MDIAEEMNEKVQRFLQLNFVEFGFQSSSVVSNGSRHADLIDTVSSDVVRATPIGYVDVVQRPGPLPIVVARWVGVLVENVIAPRCQSAQIALPMPGYQRSDPVRCRALQLTLSEAHDDTVTHGTPATDVDERLASDEQDKK